MEETVQSLVFCSEGDEMVWASIQPAHSVASRRTRHPCSRLLVKEPHVTRDGVGLMIEGIKADFDGVYVRELKNQKCSPTC